MEFRAIRRLLTVVQLGSISEAAKKLNISQPALTRSIQQLEYSYNAKLVERTAQGIKLTRVGKMLEPTFQEILNTRERIKAEINRFQSASLWHSSFGVCVSFECLVMPKVLAHLSERCPALDVQVHSGLTPALIDQVETGEIEFALGIQIPDSKEHRPQVQFEKVISDRLVIAAKHDHPLTKRDTVPRQELVKASWILPRMPGLTAEWLEGILVQNDGQGPSRSITLNSNGLARSILKSSAFITIASELSVQGDLARGDVAILNTPEFRTEVLVGLYYRKGATLSDISLWSIDVIRDVLKSTAALIPKRKRRSED